jgi:hypothetical protein
MMHGQFGWAMGWGFGHHPSVYILLVVAAVLGTVALLRRGKR